MPRPNLTALRNEMLQAGISTHHVYRTLTELDEHFDDLVDAYLEQGIECSEAEKLAVARIGDPQDISERMRRIPELKSWAWRWPKLALVIYPLACLAALPAVPVMAGVRHASSVGRWLAGMLGAGIVTATMFLVLQLTITMS